MGHRTIRKALLSLKLSIKRSECASLLTKYMHNHFVGKLRNVQVFMIKGLARNTDYSITTLFVGSEESAYQFAHLIYSEIERSLSLGKFMVCQIDPFNLPDVGITAVNSKGSAIGKFLNHGYFSLPNVSFSLDLRRPTEQIIKRSSRRRRRSIKKLLNLNYDYAISRNSEKDYDFFYWKMYSPYTKRRFGKAAILDSYPLLKGVYKRNGGIVFVNNGEKRLVGMLFQIRGKTLYARSFGVYRADQRFVTDLAGQAAMFFLIKWAKKKGMESLDFGITMPFFGNGVFTYKKEWGMRVEKHADQPFCVLKFNCLSEGVVSFLRKNPFIFLDKGVMKGVVVVDHRPTKLELQQIFSKHFLPRLDSIVVVAYHSCDREGANTTESCARVDITDTLLQPLFDICLSLQERGFLVEAYALEHQTSTRTAFVG